MWRGVFIAVTGKGQGCSGTFRSYFACNRKREHSRV